MMVSANSASCVPIEPSVAGPSARKKRADVFVELERREPRQDAAAARDRPPAEKYCRKPAISTPQAAAWPALGKERRQRQRRHHRQIEEDRRRRGAGKAVHHVEHAAIQRHQRDQQQIGKRDPGQLDREFAAHRIVGEIPAPAWRSPAA